MSGGWLGGGTLLYQMLPATRTCLLVPVQPCIVLRDLNIKTLNKNSWSKQGIVHDRVSHVNQHEMRTVSRRSRSARICISRLKMGASFKQLLPLVRHCAAPAAAAPPRPWRAAAPAAAPSNPCKNAGQEEGWRLGTQVMLANMKLGRVRRTHCCSAAATSHPQAALVSLTASAPPSQLRAVYSHNGLNPVPADRTEALAAQTHCFCTVLAHAVVHTA